MQVEADFISDLRVAFARKLEALGYAVDAADRVDVVVEKLFNLLHRTIPPHPRSVVWSAELAARGDLSNETRTALATIEGESTAGADLTRRLSRKAAGRKAKLAYDDDHLNDFRITHLHLGNASQPDGMVVGGDTLLYVAVDDEELYFVDIGTHSEFGHRRFFDIANRNWPHLYARDRLDMVVDIDGDAPEQRPRRQQGRGKLTQLIRGEDGCAYLPGGGQMLSGLSAEVARRADMTCNAVVQFQQYVKDNADAIARTIEERRKLKLDVLKMRLVIRTDGSLHAHELQSDVLIT
jgi:hypothetical protein